MKLHKTFSAWLKTRYQLVVRNEEDLAEKSTFHFSYAKLISLITILFLILVAFSLMLSTTILAGWLNPAYIEQENKTKLIQLATEVEALEQQTVRQKKFITLLQNIIKGKEPANEEVLQGNNKQPIQEAAPYTSEQLADADAQLRNGFENNEPNLADRCSEPTTDLQELFLFPPVNGVIKTPFKQKEGHYGVEIATKSNVPIKCVADGTVIFTSWTVEAGWVIMVQHNSNLVSIYKHNASLFKKVGSFVKAGDAISTLGGSRERSTGSRLHFELWHAGNAINPEHFIIF